LSGGVKGAGVHRDARTKAASGAALEAVAGDDDARQTLPLSAGTGLTEVTEGGGGGPPVVTENPFVNVPLWLSGLVTETLREPTVAVELMEMLAVS